MATQNVSTGTTDAARPGRATLWASCAAFCALIFVVIGVAVVARWPVPWSLDLAWEPLVHDWVLARPVTIDVARVVTALGSPVGMDVLAGLAAVAAWVSRRRATAIAVISVRVVELIVETAAKAVVDRPRPVFTPALATASSSSFPSGHSAGTAAVAGFLVVLLVVALRLPGWARRARAGAVALVVVLSLFTLAVALSRVVLGVHYPSDVVAGLLLGGACAGAGQAVLAALGRK